MKSFSSTHHNKGDYPDSQILNSPSQEMPRGWSSRHGRPRRIKVFLHAAKTCKLIGALLADRRIPLWRKALFFGSIGGLLIILLFPDTLNEVVLSTVLPLAGTMLGIPLDAGFDWIAFAMAIVTLLRFFPAELVAQHYQRVFS